MQRFVAIDFNAALFAQCAHVFDDERVQPIQSRFGLVFLNGLVMPWAPEVLMTAAPDVAVVMVVTAAGARAKTQHGGAGGGFGFVSDVGRLSGHGKRSQQRDN